MPSLDARHYASGQPVRLEWEGPRITGLRSGGAALPSPSKWLAPALFDLQVNGFAGVDFQQPRLTVESLCHATQSLRHAGCLRFFPTLITAEWKELLRRLQQFRALRDGNPHLEAAMVGWHIEGPFLSTETGYHGAHDPALMPDPTPQHILDLRAAAGPEPLLLTIAPERAGAIEAIRLATRLNMRVSLGHTNAPVEVLHQACLAGATGFTHLGNACPQLLDRHDNILWRILDLPNLSLSLIPDGIHVSPALFRLVHRLVETNRLCYVSDATAAAAAPAGLYTLGHIPIQSGTDQIVRQPGKANFAGSALRPIDGVFRAARMLGCSWRTAWDAFSVRPARFAGLDAGLCVGGRADFCLLSLDAADNLKGLSLFQAGEQIA